MTVPKVITLEAAPDLRQIYVSAALKRRRVGDTLPDVRVARAGVSVDVPGLAAYARVCRLPLGATLPLTYPHLLAFPLQMVVMAGDGFPLPLLGAVHVENRIEVTRAVAVDELLDIDVWAQDLRPHRRGTQVDLVSEVSTRGELVWRGVSTYLARGAEHPDAPRSEAPSTTPLAAVTGGPQWRLGDDTGRAYAGVSGDWNPIHLHALTARPLGFPGAIAHGMYTYARAMGSLGPRLAPEGLTSRVWFRKPVPLPSTVRLRTAFAPESTLSVLESASGDTEHAVVENTWAP
ncbi:MaoC family dehydratase [Humibacillus xanthopallidus]|uniref:MaoC family dehydratase n=1 Tax=Humibacillus xanthopallidus TaxID=412689 RepID=UPI001FE40344|nr:MaoC/PaaZ C-terminal domain-containing protein [Humibacillus xanthopallidus]